ncbi:hypothetical protein PhaeoP128_03697 (plasmid) [Phaeobacter gallaeciensis]|nr:hypothetical protein PhaeoP129_03696 [Phaeobacter gallaeciensis]ATF24394.1 hypothetical protein PhaeoP128_03697 [Phaeobacter gallaeciensis]
MLALSFFVRLISSILDEIALIHASPLIWKMPMTWFGRHLVKRCSAYRVGFYVNKVGHEGQECIEAA